MSVWEEGAARQWPSFNARLVVECG